MHSLNIFQHNVFQTDTIFTKAVSPICTEALTPRTPSTVQKSRLVMKAHLNPQVKQTTPCRISHQFKSSWLRSIVVGATKWSILSCLMMRDMGNPNTVIHCQ